MYSLDGSLVSEHLVGPPAYGAHALDSGDAVVGDQHLLDNKEAAELGHELLRRGCRQVLLKQASENDSEVIFQLLLYQNLELCCCFYSFVVFNIPYFSE